MFEFLKRLFPNKKEGGLNVDEKTLPLVRNHALKAAKKTSSTKYKFASCQSPGKARFHNEDTLFTLSSELSGLDAPVYFGIFLVADGMGGHQSGEVASSLAAQAVSSQLMDRLFNAVIYEGLYEGHYEGQSNSEEEILQLLNDAVNEAQVLIHRQLPGGGTTLTLALVIGEQVYTAHVGDSRLYLIGNDGQLSLKTKDHSLVKRLVDLGEISDKEASTHPQRNVLYRALGQEDSLEPDLDQFTLEPGEKLMICSDGLWGVLDQNQMESILKREKPLEKISCELVDAANEAGGPDNISVVVVERLK